MTFRTASLIGLITLPLLIALHQPGTAAPAGTLVAGAITQDTTWTLGGSPYYLQNEVTVFPGATLTIEPAVQVMQDDTNGVSGITIRGRLLAEGTAAQPITFGRGPVTPGSHDYWPGLKFEGEPLTPIAGSLLDYVVIDHGGGPGSGSDGAIVLVYATLTVRHAQITNSDGDGILGNDAAAGGVAHISDTSFSGNRGYAVYFENAAVNPVLSHLTATGNGVDVEGGDGNVVALGEGTMTGQHVWEQMDLPYRLLHFDSCFTADGVAPGASLTIEPGVVVQSATTLPVAGALFAHGTAAQPIRFTRVTNSPGAWLGLDICGTEEQRASADLTHVLVEHGGSAGANIMIEQGDLVLADSRIEHSAGDGVSTGRDVHLKCTGVSFVGNAGNAVVVSWGAVQDTGHDPEFQGLTATGNGHDAIRIMNTRLAGAHVWEDGGIPYLVNGDLVVPGGATLTIRPGVEVAFDEGAGLTIAELLQAVGVVGTEIRPITFTGVIRQAGSWQGLAIQGAGEQRAHSILSHVLVEYGGSAGGANLTISEAELELVNSRIEKSGGDGIAAGLAVGMKVADTAFVNNGGAALAAYDTLPQAVELDPLFQRLTATGNRQNAIWLAATVLAGGSGVHHWEDGGIPYRVGQSLQVLHGATLDIASGVTVEFAEAAQFDVSGALQARGAATAPITFTGYFTAAPAPGWWSGVQFLGSPDQHANGDLQFVTVEYGGREPEQANVLLDFADVRLEHCTIRFSGHDGVLIVNGAIQRAIHTITTGAASVAIAWSHFVANSGNALTNRDVAHPVQATYNWWGAASGPAGTANPVGTGGSVSAGVNFRPFLVGPDPDFAYLPLVGK